MNEFSNRLGAIAQGVSREFEAAAPDDSAALIRRAKRGRVVWTGTVGTATLATAAAVAVGGNAAASTLFDSTPIEPATPTKPAIEEAKAIPVPAAHWSTYEKLREDSLAAEAAREKAAKEKAEKLAAKKAAKEKAAKEKAAKEKAAKAKNKSAWKHKHGDKWSKDKDCYDDHKSGEKSGGDYKWKKKWKDKGSGGDSTGGEGGGESTEPTPESTEG